MRTRDWRRYKEKVKVINRLKMIHNSWYYRYRDANGNIISNYTWIDQIGTNNHFMYKTFVTNKYSTKESKRWGKSGRYNWAGHNNRVKDKRFFTKMLEMDYGVKNFNNINYESVKNYTG